MDIDVAALRNEIRARQQSLRETYALDNNAQALLRNRCQKVDIVLTKLWTGLGFPATLKRLPAPPRAVKTTARPRLCGTQQSRPPPAMRADESPARAIASPEMDPAPPKCTVLPAAP